MVFHNTLCRYTAAVDRAEQGVAAKTVRAVILAGTFSRGIEILDIGSMVFIDPNAAHEVMDAG